MANQQKETDRIGDARERDFLALRARLLALNSAFEAARLGEGGFALARTSGEAGYLASAPRRRGTGMRVDDAPKGR
ncbi:MAG: hypothetical protein JW821_14060 [Deltaproteobacteria bacterium]|nr:hypothetical protein [Deltaproteobacteria bacterium]